MTPEERIARNLRAAREAAGLTQEELGFRSEIHRTQITLYETAKRVPSTRSLLKLAGVCGVTVDDLLAGVEWMPAEHAFGRFTVGEDDG